MTRTQIGKKFLKYYDEKSSLNKDQAWQDWQLGSEALEVVIDFIEQELKK